MANPTMTLIASNVLSSGSATNVTFSSIPATYTDLIVKTSMRSLTNDGSPWNRINYNFNGDTGANYAGILFDGTGSGTATSTLGNTYNSYWITGNTATSNTFANSEVYIPNYTSSNYKSSSVDSVTENNGTAAIATLLANLWSSTSAITSITFSNYGSGFAQYSSFYLYGIKNS